MPHTLLPRTVLQIMRDFISAAPSHDQTSTPVPRPKTDNDLVLEYMSMTELELERMPRDCSRGKVNRALEVLGEQLSSFAHIPPEEWSAEQCALMLKFNTAYSLFVRMGYVTDPAENFLTPCVFDPYADVT